MAVFRPVEVPLLVVRAPVIALTLLGLLLLAGCASKRVYRQPPDPTPVEKSREEPARPPPAPGC